MHLQIRRMQEMARDLLLRSGRRDVDDLVLGGLPGSVETLLLENLRADHFFERTRYRLDSHGK